LWKARITIFDPRRSPFARLCVICEYHGHDLWACPALSRYIGGGAKDEIPCADYPPVKRRTAKVRLQPPRTPFFIGDRVFYGSGEDPNPTLLSAAMGPPEKHNHPPSCPFSDVLVSKRLYFANADISQHPTELA
jgi:hypothetical protein